MRLLIAGAGGYGRLVKEIAGFCGYSTVHFLDDAYADAAGKLDDLENLQEDYDGCIIAIGNKQMRRRLFKTVKDPVTLIHPAASVSPSAKIGKGCVIEAGAVVSTDAVIGDGTYVCAGAVVNHNAVVGAFSQVDCNGAVMAGAELPEESHVISCSTVLRHDMKMPEAFGNESFF